MLIFVLTVLVILNGVSFALYGIDKRRAIKKQYRISEKALLCWGAIAPFGGYIGMKLFSHKTKKNTFQITLFVMCIVWFVAIGTMLNVCLK